MTENSWIDFERRRGIVWVCDVQDSTASLNDDKYVDAIEEYLPRLLWIGEQIVESAGGEFIKWTGDGFLAWFDCKIERNMGKEAAAAFNAAWHLSLTNNVTNLKVDSQRQFIIRHGIIWEPDALVMNIKHSNQKDTKDLIGRKIVLAFRCSGIRVDFPHIVTENQLKKCTQKTQVCNYKFKNLDLNNNDILSYFKGEKQFTRFLVGSSEARKSKESKRSLVEQVMRTLIPKPITSERCLATVSEYMRRLRSGPAWAKNVYNKEIDFMRAELESACDILEIASKKQGKQKIENERLTNLIAIIREILNEIEE